MKTLIDLFNFGMMRKYPDIISDCDPTFTNVLHLGPGAKKIDGCSELEYPRWDAETDVMPYASDSFDQIHAYHFFEHIQNLVPLIQECHRVLKPGGHINIVVPYYNSQLAIQDLDHKRFFCENTWRTLFDRSSYQKGKIDGRFEIATNLIMGDSEKNLCLITQLVKIV